MQLPIFFSLFLIAFVSSANNFSSDSDIIFNGTKGKLSVFNLSLNTFDFSIHGKDFSLISGAGLNYECDGIDLIEISSPLYSMPLLVNCDHTLVFKGHTNNEN